MLNVRTGNVKICVSKVWLTIRVMLMRDRGLGLTSGTSLNVNITLALRALAARTAAASFGRARVIRALKFRL